MTTYSHTLNISNPCFATIDVQQSYTIGFAPGVKLEASFRNLNPTKPAQIGVLIGSQQLPPLLLQPGQTQTQTYDISQFSYINFINEAPLRDTPVYIFVQQLIIN
jgi:hypothetical protein